jgi:hypothetical protein
MGSLGDEALQRFKASLHLWNQTCDLRPTYLRRLTGRNDYAALTDPELDEVTP